MPPPKATPSSSRQARRTGSGHGLRRCPDRDRIGACRWLLHVEVERTGFGPPAARRAASANRRCRAKTAGSPSSNSMVSSSRGRTASRPAACRRTTCGADRPPYCPSPSSAAAGRRPGHAAPLADGDEAQPGGSISPFCEAASTTSAPMASIGRSITAREAIASTTRRAGWPAQSIARRTAATSWTRPVEVSIWTWSTALIRCSRSAWSASSIRALSSGAASRLQALDRDAKPSAASCQRRTTCRCQRPGPSRPV